MSTGNGDLILDIRVDGDAAWLAGFSELAPGFAARLIAAAGGRGTVLFGAGDRSLVRIEGGAAHVAQLAFERGRIEQDVLRAHQGAASAAIAWVEEGADAEAALRALDAATTRREALPCVDALAAADACGPFDVSAVEVCFDQPALAEIRLSPHAPWEPGAPKTFDARAAALAAGAALLDAALDGVTPVGRGADSIVVAGAPAALIERIAAVAERTRSGDRLVQAAVVAVAGCGAEALRAVAARSRSVRRGAVAIDDFEIDALHLPAIVAAAAAIAPKVAGVESTATFARLLARLGSDTSGAAGDAPSAQQRRNAEIHALAAECGLRDLLIEFPRASEVSRARLALWLARERSESRRALEPAP